MGIGKLSDECEIFESDDYFTSKKNFNSTKINW